MVAILDKTTSKQDATTDVRARAATAKNLMVNATVESVDENTGKITVQNVYFSDTSRSGEAKDMGTWIVTPPDSFYTATLSPGTKVAIGVDA
jgi:polygalacturonase